MRIDVFARGIPRGQPRARGVKTKGGNVRMWTPSTAEAWKGEIADAVKPYLNGNPWTGPLCVRIYHYFQRPKSHYGTGRNKHRVKDSAPSRHTQTPDVDNLAKAALDALTQVGLWRDDCQVVNLLVSKFWSEDRQGARLVVHNEC